MLSIATRQVSHRIERMNDSLFPEGWDICLEGREGKRGL